MPISVFAYGVSFSCPSTIKSNETFTCTIYSPTSCSEITMQLVLPDGFTLIKDIAGDNFESLSENNNLSYKGAGPIDRVLATLTIKASEKTDSRTITLKNVKYKYTEKNSEFEITTDLVADFNFKVDETKKENEVKNYILTLDSTIEGENPQTLSCTPVNKSCEILLSNATIPIKTDYVFNGWGEKADCTSGEKEKVTLKSDKTLYACFISNQVGHLKELTIEGYELNFNSNTLEYNLEVDSDVKTLKVNAIAYNKDAKINIDNPDLTDAGGKITITVTENDAEVIYTINVQRKAKEKPLLSSLLIRDYALSFDSNTFEYDLIIKRGTKQLDIAAIPNMENVNMEILGNNDLTDGSTVSIVLVSADNSSSIYTITITVETIFMQYKYYFMAAGIIIFMFTVYFIVRHIKRKNGEYPMPNGDYVKNVDKPKEEKTKKEKKVKVKKDKKKKKEEENNASSIPNAESPIETLDI